ncbi:MAG: YlmH/Sll1252 family protein [Mogibacterium sp.]|nr:YlmH/Sll1252 family protein [Mogibacterium sp.]
MTKDELTLAKIEDKIRQSRDGWYVTATGFLDSHEQALAKRTVMHAAGVRTLMYGGYDDAERRMLVCVPADLPISDEEAVDGLVMVLRVTKPAMSRALSHRDYLGSVLGLGIERRLTGDILVRDDGADIFIVPEIADFLMREYHQAGRTEVKTRVVPAGEVIVPEMRCEIIKDTVSSVRLDSVISSAFRVSRNTAAEAVRSGLVSVDHAECLKVDAKVEEGAILVMKGKGKAILEEIGKESKKKRTWIRIKRFL